VLFFQALTSIVDSDAVMWPIAGGEFRQVLMLQLAPVNEAR
jgi:hypothetical protein